MQLYAESTGDIKTNQHGTKEIWQIKGLFQVRIPNDLRRKVGAQTAHHHR
jgi:hypothetical protein